MSVRLSDLINEPFGPFLEEDALTTTVPNTTQRNIVALECLLLEGNGRITGLDECEQFQPEYNKELYEVQKVPVRFHGVLEIQRLTWLTPEAIAGIEEDLRDRDLAARATLNPEARPSTLTLKQMYHPTPGFSGGQLKIKVKIQGTRINTAVYLNADDVPRTLMLNTMYAIRRTRRYAVNSMHINTYELSRRYLSRYQLHYTLRTLLALDAGSNTHANNHTKLEKRTPEWFIDLYFKHFAYLGAARQHRPLYIESDSDIERNTAGRMKAGREHTLRHVSRAEVRSRIAEHAKWLIEEQKLNNKNKWIDVDIWTAWLGRVGHLRREAKEAGRVFGVWDGADVSLEDDTDLEDLPRRPNPARRKSKPATKTTRRAASPRTVDVYLPEPYTDEAMMRTYDPDFSPPSTTLGSPTSTPSRPSTPVDPDLLARLPSQLWYPPNVNALLIWPCPWDGCSYTINLLHPKEEDMDHPDITEEDKQRFRSRTWKGPRDVRAREAFAYMVDKHHDYHFRELGIEFDLFNGRRVRFPISSLRMMMTD
ncbi:hypothetical protein BD309DRAFT_854147 [Dichomitus squalens]|nr:hypothetical protein BD309DRAFT_854147 [Dichomitus squalens]